MRETETALVKLTRLRMLLLRMADETVHRLAHHNKNTNLDLTGQ